VNFLDPRLPDHFWSKCIPEPNSGCWLWLAGRNEKGYGQFKWDGRTQRAHRITYLVLVGPVSNGLELDHKCRIRECCNPAHLEAVTHQINCKRGNNGVRFRERTACGKGHEYTEKNTRIDTDGSRVCVECMKLYMRAHRARRRAA
jgi:hypothetical protein